MGTKTYKLRLEILEDGIQIDSFERTATREQIQREVTLMAFDADEGFYDREPYDE